MWQIYHLHQQVILADRHPPPLLRIVDVNGPGYILRVLTMMSDAQRVRRVMYQLRAAKC